MSHEPLPPPAATQDLWASMCRVLPGTWKSDSANGKSVTESFRVVSASSALVESFVTSSHRETLSVYYPDGGSLLLTHYCAQGNQPRLRATEISDDAVVFRFVDATNVRESQSVLVEKRLHLSGDTLEQTEIYRNPDGTIESTLFRFARVRTP